MKQDELILIGKLGRPRGVHGDIWVTPFTDWPDRFLDLEEVHLQRRGQWEKVSVKSARIIGGRPVLRLEDISSPEEASRFTNCELAVPIGETVELPEDTFFVFDLIGCEVFDSELDQMIGRVEKVENYPANDVYVVRTMDGKELSVPVVKQFVRKVDVENKKIDIVSTGLEYMDES